MVCIFLLLNHLKATGLIWLIFWGSVGRGTKVMVIVCMIGNRVPAGQAVVGLTSVSPRYFIKLFYNTVLAEFCKFLIVLLFNIMIIDNYQMVVCMLLYCILLNQNTGTKIERYKIEISKTQLSFKLKELSKDASIKIFCVKVD